MNHTLQITETGELQFVWSDDLACMRELGPAVIRRVSHVEPTADGRWSADMSPAAGPMLGPFELHGEALTAEREWLAANLGI